MITLTEEQENALQSVLKLGGHRILTGSAGCGKSVLIRELVKLGYSPLGATNKVAAAIGGRTVHSFLAALPYYNEKGEVEFCVGGGASKGGLVVDEAFMLTKDCLQQLYNTPDIIFVGDMRQLPPVGEFESDLIVRGLPIVELTTCMRFGSTIAEIANAVLAAENMTELVTAFQQIPKTQADFESTFLSYKNETVRDNWVAYCKSLERSVGFIPGDTLIVKPSHFLRKELGVVNGDVLTVSSVRTGPAHSVISGSIDAVGNCEIYVPTRATLDEIEQVKKALIATGSPTSKDFFHALKPYGYLSYVTPSNTCTVHKAQGMSIDRVTVSKDILNCRQFSLAKALLYTAVTRAKVSVMRNN